MAMIYLGNSTYFDTDDLDDLDYSEFCKHRENLRKYYKYRNDKNAILKGKLIGIDIKEIIDKAEEFIFENILGMSYTGKNKEFQQVMFNIANNIEE